MSSSVLTPITCPSNAIIVHRSRNPELAVVAAKALFEALSCSSREAEGIPKFIYKFSATLKALPA